MGSTGVAVSRARAKLASEDAGRAVQGTPVTKSWEERS